MKLKNKEGIVKIVWNPNVKIIDNKVVGPPIKTRSFIPVEEIIQALRELRLEMEKEIDIETEYLNFKCAIYDICGAIGLSDQEISQIL